MQALSLRPVASPEVPPAPSAPQPSQAPRLIEPLTPFVPWSPEERAPLPGVDAADAEERSLLVELLREPLSIVERLLDPSRLQGVVLGSLGIIVASASAMTLVTTRAMVWRGTWWWLPSVAASLGVLGSLAASIGPIYATSMLVSARVPLARLMGALLAATATGSVLLAALAPPVYVLWALDREWAGPLMFCFAFGLAGIVSGARIHGLLKLMAQAVTRAALGDPTAVLSTEDAFRVGIVARVACMLLAFTLACCFWPLMTLG